MRNLFLSIPAMILMALAAVSGGRGHAQEAGMLLQSDLVRLGAIGWIAPGFVVPKVDENLPLIDPKNKTAGAVLLQELVEQGRAGGFDGVIYENRDDGHSSVRSKRFPALPRLSFGPKLKQEKLHYGLGGNIFLPAIVIGNSSTALTQRNKRRSLPRLAMTRKNGPNQAFLTYSNNHIYVYPEHRDHDDVDLFPANWPYMVISQGSSSSDKPFLRALIMTVAALSDDTREFLRDKKLVSPTLQMILRRSQTHVLSREAYLTGSAHPSVFDASKLAPERMIALAAALVPGDVPPMVRLKIESEDFSIAAGLANYSEHLFDTPSAIARVWRGPEYTRSMIVSAHDTHDPNGRALTFDWALLRGDNDKVRITPLDDAGARARIEIDWHDPRVLEQSEGRVTHRVDIGVFASNGVYDSAPAMISVSFPSHQRRIYTMAAGKQRLRTVDYRSGLTGTYYDPWVYWAANWRDEFSYDDAGKISGWVRYLNGTTQILRNPKRPDQIKTPIYAIDQRGKGPVLVVRNGGDLVD